MSLPFDQARRVWKFGNNLFRVLNPDDISVAAKWPIITTGDVNTTGLTAVVGPLGKGDTSVCGMAGAASEAQHGIKPIVGLTAELHELVVYARAGDKSWLYLEDHTISNVTAYFNITSGSHALGTIGSACTAAIKNVGNGWYRCSIRFTGTVAAHTFEISAADADGDKSFTGDGSTVNVYIWKPGVYAVRAVVTDDAAFGGALRSTDDGDLLIGGLGEDGRASALNVSKANATRSTADRVALVQEVSPTGGTTKDVNILQVGGHTASHNSGTVDDGTIRVTQATDVVLRVSKDGSANATGNRIFTTVNQDQLNGTAIAQNAGNLSDGVQRVTLCTDGLVGNVTGTPGSAKKSSTFQVGGQDGTNLQTLYVDSNGVLYIQPAVVPTFEDATNGYAKTRPTSHASACSADVATVTVDGTTEGTADEIIPSTNVSTYRGFTLWVENLGATAFSHVYVYASRDGTNWVCVDSLKNALEIICDTLGATSNGICFSVTTNPGWQYVKCAATVAAGSTTATGALSYQM